MLQNAYFLAKTGADTAENDRNCAKKLKILANLADPRPRSRNPELTSAVLAPSPGSLDRTELMPRSRNVAAIDKNIRGALNRALRRKAWFGEAGD